MSIEKIKKIVVIGAGIMGQGIAQNFAQAGLGVHVVDVNSEALIHCKQQLSISLGTFEDFSLLTEPLEKVLERVQFLHIDDLSLALENCDFVVEALPEILELKQNLFSKLDSLPEHVILASNTSSMTISTLAKGLLSKHRLIGLHYFNPAHIIPAVEVHTGNDTSEKTVSTTIALMKAVGKTPVLVRKEVPGFIINRLTGAMEREIDYLLDEGVVTPEDLDTAIKASYGFRLACLGPMEAEDMIGLDTAARASNNIFPTLSNATKASPNLMQKVKLGELGIKSGKGWYDYPDKDKQSIIDNNNRRLLSQLKLFMSSE